MKKYLQITVVLGIFGLLVLLRQARGSDQPTVVAPQNQTPGNDTGTITNTPTNGNSQQPTNPPNPAVSNTSSTTTNSTYKDGTYTGSVEDAFYGNLQVQAVIAGGKITDINFLQYPNDNPTSRSINEQASVYLKQEALTAQNAQVDIVSGASDSSQAFRLSLATALSQAH